MQASSLAVWLSAAILPWPPAVQQQAASRPAPPRLTARERAAGWHLLFDGKTPSAWRGYRRKDFPDRGWSVAGTALVHAKGGGGGDLVTRRRYRNFELALEWKIGPGGNSGIIYRASEEEPASYMTGPEFQILDDAAFPGTGPRHRAGALYGLYAAGNARPKPAGQWNRARILVRGASLTHWLNGIEIARADLSSKDWAGRVARSKFAKWKQFGRVRRGHICLQDHGDEVAYRNIRIRELGPTKDRMGDPVVLFDGKDLDRWSAHLQGGAGLDDVWSIAPDGVLVCKGRPAGYLYTKDLFESFVLQLDWRFDPVTKKAGNSGVLLRMTGPHRVWPRSIEAQLQSGNAGDFWNIGDFPMRTVRARTRGRNTKKTHGNERPIGEWNTYEIIADGPWVSLRVNGEVVNEAWDCEVVRGRICLQSEGAVIHFRNIRLIPLQG